MRRSIVAVAALAAASNAQGLGNISSACQSAASQLLTSPLSTCANLLTLVSLATSSGSIVTGVQTYVTGICTKDPCSTDVVTSARTQLQAGCKNDIASGNNVIVALNAILSDYPDTRNLFCGQQSNNGTYCLPSTLQNIQTATGQNITLSTLSNLVSGGGLSSLVNSVPASAVCTDCGHAIITSASKIVANTSTTAASQVASAAASKCGASFSDGQIPSSISTSGNVAVSSTRSTAARLTMAVGPAFGVAAGALAIVAGAAVVFA